MDPNKKVFVDEIRKVHKDLRRKYQKDPDFSKIWEEHCKNEETLNKYAKSMQDLATVIWDEDCDGTHRINWCVDTCKKYFLEKEINKYLEKDERRKRHYKKDPTQFHLGPNPFESFNDEMKDVSERSFCLQSKLRLLDVGSCYDPFKKYEEFETTAIDLRPACETVHKCDFIKVDVSSDIKEEEKFQQTVTTLSAQQAPEISILPSSYFHIVVFSLLLTYIPSPQVRWEICQKAHKVLQTNGLLLIITPDSSHQNKNAALMKRWKNAIEQIGFQRIKYSKDRHLHFMAFRKVPPDFLWDKRKISEIYSNKIEKLCLNIPQDFHDCDDGTENKTDNDITNDFSDVTKDVGASTNDITKEISDDRCIQIK
uniref:S-adenosylmethionine sensor upstream of mTORC1-like n=1 Tax=Styela clava TaxID=7725 RepID=UPI001939ADC5|nr:S-adenosylmethionine sensor upstream of mTORC1-like [Styela clava]